MSYYINICFDLVGRVQNPAWQAASLWPFNPSPLQTGLEIRQTDREKHFNVMENLLHLFFFLPILQRVHLKIGLFIRSVRKDFVRSLGNASLELM